MKKKIRIAIYSRKSKFSDKGDSVGNQIEIAMNYINHHYPIDEYEAETVIFEDDGYSGGSIERPRFKEFLIEEDKNPFDILICYRLDRISRNIAHFSNLMNRLSELGTSFVSIKEQFDTKTPMGRAMMYIASVFAQLEREVIAERIKDNMIELAKTGRWLGGPKPTGYKSEKVSIVDIFEVNEDNILEAKKKTASKLIPIEDEIELIEQIAYKFLELKSLTHLESYFIRNKILTKNNIDFSVSTLRRILTNPLYAPNDKYVLEYFKNKGITIYADGNRAKFDGKYGLLGYGKFIGTKDENNKENLIISVGFHPPAIKDGWVWVQIQELIEKNKDKRYRADCKHDFLFSGILKCSKCGSYMRPKVAQGERFYYTCELKEKSRGTRCNSRNITGLALDKLVMQKLKELFIPSSEICQELSKMALKKDKVLDEETKKEELLRKIKKNKESIKNLVDKLKHVDIEVVDFVNKELKSLKEQNIELENELQILEKNHSSIQKEESITPEVELTIINNCFKVFYKIDLKSRKDILKMLIEDMKGNGDSIEIELSSTKLSDIDKRLFSDMFEEATNKK